MSQPKPRRFWPGTAGSAWFAAPAFGVVGGLELRRYSCPGCCGVVIISTVDCLNEERTRPARQPVEQCLRVLADIPAVEDTALLPPPSGAP